MTLPYGSRRYVTAREFRARMKSILEGAEARVIGERRGERAIVIPIPAFRQWDDKERRKAMAAVRKAFKALMAEMG